tara:strand:- start:492 stop:1298 length:807 start_codon:yes stop_codon:yes gene_type:complete
VSFANIQGGFAQNLQVLSTVQGGDVRFRGRVDSIGLPKRFELRWVPGLYGIPSANADILSSTEATNITCDRNFEILGTNAVTDDAVMNAEGGIRLTTQGADGDEVILVPHQDANQSAWEQVTWGTDKEVEWECEIKTGSAAQIDNCIIWAGLKLTNAEATATDDDQVFFRYENGVNDGKWQVIYSIGGTDTAADAGIAAVAATTKYHLKIVIDDARLAKMYINDVLCATSTALTDTTDLNPYIGVAADGAAEAKILDVYGQAISRVSG